MNLDYGSAANDDVAENGPFTSEAGRETSEQRADRVIAAFFRSATPEDLELIQALNGAFADDVDHKDACVANGDKLLTAREIPSGIEQHYSFDQRHPDLIGRVEAAICTIDSWAKNHLHRHDWYFPLIHQLAKQYRTQERSQAGDHGEFTEANDPRYQALMQELPKYSALQHLSALMAFHDGNRHMVSCLIPALNDVLSTIPFALAVRAGVTSEDFFGVAKLVSNIAIIKVNSATIFALYAGEHPGETSASAAETLNQKTAALPGAYRLQSKIFDASQIGELTNGRVHLTVEQPLDSVS